jgi:hypothetical protein
MINHKYSELNAQRGAKGLRAFAQSRLSVGLAMFVQVLLRPTKNSSEHKTHADSKRQLILPITHNSLVYFCQFC